MWTVILPDYQFQVHARTEEEAYREALKYLRTHLGEDDLIVYWED